MTRSRKRLAGCGTGLLAALLAIALLVHALSDPSPVGHFRSAEGERAYKQSYRAAMTLLPAPSRTLDVVTSYGIVRVYEFSYRDDNAAPVVLLPGRTSGVPMWASNLKDLAARRTVFALDALGDAGFSVQKRAVADASDQAGWLEETFAQLGISKLHLVGHSFGGWLAANYAVRFPQRVQSLSLLERVFVFQGLRWQVYAETIPAALPFLPQSMRDRMLRDIGGTDAIDTEDPVAQMIAAATTHFSAKLPIPDRITDNQLRGLHMPVYLALGARSFMHDSALALRVAQINVKNLRSKNWAEATHSLPMQFAPQLDTELLKFFAEHDVHADGSRVM